MSKQAQQEFPDKTRAPLEFSPRELVDLIGGSLVDVENPPEEICRHIESLREMVHCHFSDDTEEEIFEEAVFEAPWLAPLSECLRQQREELVQMIDQLVALAHVGDSSDDWRQQVGVVFEEFVELFFEHDAGVRNLMHSQEGWREE